VTDDIFGNFESWELFADITDYGYIIWLVAVAGWFFGRGFLGGHEFESR